MTRLPLPALSMSADANLQVWQESTEHRFVVNKLCSYVTDEDIAFQPDAGVLILEHAWFTGPGTAVAAGQPRSLTDLLTELGRGREQAPRKSQAAPSKDHLSQIIADNPWVAAYLKPPRTEPSATLAGNEQDEVQTGQSEVDVFEAAWDAVQQERQELEQAKPPERDDFTSLPRWPVECHQP